MSSKAAPEVKSASSTPVRSFTPSRSPRLQRKCACNGPGDCDECRKKKPAMQRKEAGPEPVNSIPPIVSSVMESSGRPLEPETRSLMESRFGQDFSQVRVHTDSQAAESARAVNAHAYTVGQDIAFASGKYDPHSHSGRHLLAHELAHTVQQRGLQRSSASISLDGGSEYNRLESEADSAAAAAMQGDVVALNRPADRPILSKAGEGTVTPAPTKKTKQKTSSLGIHNVTPTEVFTAGGADLEEFNVDAFYLPATKGPNALPIYQGMASGGSLEATLEIQGASKTKTALWQEREETAELRDLWLQKVGWNSKVANDLWERSGGDSEFPKIGGVACQMDHIVELQVGGTNPPENMQPLNAAPNRESGGQIKNQLQSLAVAIVNDTQLSSGSAKQVKMRFASVKQRVAPEKLPASCPPKGTARTCLAVEECAKKLKIEKTAEGTITVARADYPISAGGRPASILKVPVTFTTRANETVPIESDPQNSGAKTHIPGLLLTTLAHVSNKVTKPDVIQAKIDDRDKTRLPISLSADAKPVKLNVAADGKLTLDPASKKGAIGFTYKYLSKGTITEIGVDENGETTWKGTITPSVPLIGTLGLEYSKGSLAITKGLEEETLKKRSVLGMRITEAKVGLQLAPEFKPSGTIAMAMGSETNPLATARLTLETDSVGLIAKGKIKVNIPRLQTAESDITYKGGEGRDEWFTEIHIKTENINLGSSISVTGGFDGMLDKSGIKFTGKINATFPGNNTAELGLGKDDTGWILFGGGTFNFPKLDPVTIKATYFLGKEKLVATGKTGFTIPAIGLRGRLDEVTFTLEKDKPLVVTGKGGLDFKKGKAEGHVNVTLLPTGKFMGKGSLSYALKENIIVTGIVELNEKEKLRVTGELLITRYEIFKKYEKNKDLFKFDIPVPIPGLSIGTSGVVFKITGGVGAGFSFGPGTIEPLKFSAGFDPLEADPDLELTVTGSVKIPASATLSAFISGSLAIQIDVVIASAGAEGGLKLKGDLTLSAGAFANFEAAYKKKQLTAKLVAGIETKLLLGLTLSAFARAWAGAFGITGEIRKDWVLAQKTIDTGLGFYVSAPFEYSDATGVKLPELKDITVKQPELDIGALLSRIFGQAKTTETES